MNMNKAIATVAAFGCLILAVFAFTGVSEAQTDGYGDAAASTTESTVVLAQVGTDTTDADSTDTDSRDRSGRRGCGKNSEVIAEVIGISVEELQSAKDAGSSVAEIAQANGVDPQTVIDALIADVADRLDAKVVAGDLTAEEAAEKLESKSERITNKIAG